MMDTKQIALKLLLEGLDESEEIASVNDRLRIQKAIYMCQELGINLGYHYSWYVKGPYSTNLTQDYYQMNEALTSGDVSHASRVLNPSILKILPKVKDVLAMPKGVNLPTHMWYEALASVHFLMKSSGYSLEKTKEFLSRVKPHLDGYIDKSVEHLKKHGLLS